MIVPLFPLRGVFLFPGAVLPLHIFEARYRQMVEDLMDTAGRLVIGTTTGESDPGFEASPPVHPVAGLGEISGHERLPDGRFLIALYGLDRVVIEEVTSDRPYRLVAASSLVETAFLPERAQEYRSRLDAALRRRSGTKLEVPKDFPTERMIDMLMMQAAAPSDEMARIYGLPDLAARAEAALNIAGAEMPGTEE